MPVPSYSSDRGKPLSRRRLTPAPTAGEKLLWRPSHFAGPSGDEEDSFSSIVRTATAANACRAEHPLPRPL
jgi:hypothetical protein